MTAAFYEVLRCAHEAYEQITPLDGARRSIAAERRASSAENRLRDAKERLRAAEGRMQVAEGRARAAKGRAQAAMAPMANAAAELFEAQDAASGSRREAEDIRKAANGWWQEVLRTREAHVKDEEDIVALRSRNAVLEVECANARDQVSKADGEAKANDILMDRLLSKVDAGAASRKAGLLEGVEKGRTLQRFDDAAVFSAWFREMAGKSEEVLAGPAGPAKASNKRKREGKV